MRFTIRNPHETFTQVAADALGVAAAIALDVACGGDVQVLAGPG